MSGYTKLRVEAENDHTTFRVRVKGWLGWKSGFVYTDYFAISYESEKAALDAIERYRNRFTEA